ncbi:hypothetical protein F5Y04DRAFT_75357 [Hypomontagnella monticulosa]|nr:hypothetical protein F5Y04DRAFT_75357 [Hypomontagnella monticulosa]
MNDASSAGYGFDSTTWTESGTLVSTPSTSRASSISQPSSTNIPSGPLDLTLLSTTSWRHPYPSVGQFAMTKSEEIVAAGPDGLFYFRRVQDHAAKPWSEPRAFPNIRVTLNEFTVSGLTLYYSQRQSRLYLYCVSGGALYSFYLADKEDPSFLPDNSPSLAGHCITGKPAVVRTNSTSVGNDQWSLVIPSQSGGLLHKSATNFGSYNEYVSTRWGDVNHLATDLGIISAVSVAAVKYRTTYNSDEETDLVAVCISSGQLNVVQGPLCRDAFRDRMWKGKTSTRILHPGEVTGNPELITDARCGKAQLDLLVPSTEGGIFHFVCMRSAPNDWHMIGRVAFPQNIPPASCLSFHSRSDTYWTHELYALIQIGGRLYHVKTTNERLPWCNARLNPVVKPGPFFD